MTYYKILKILVIFWIINGVFSILSCIAADSIIDTCFMVVSTVLIILAAIGLWQKKWDGIIFLYYYFLFDIAVMIFLLIFSDQTDKATIAGGLIVDIIFYIPTKVYFDKRKPIFSIEKDKYSDLEDQYCNSLWKNNTTSHDTSEKMISDNAVKYCRKCGAELIEGSSYCSNCGEKVII